MNEEDKILEEIRQAVSGEDDGSLLQIMNEYIGFLREQGRFEESYAIGEKIIDLAQKMGLEGSIPYATCLLNVAAAYRAGGDMGRALSLYDEVEQVYTTSLPSKSMLLAGLYNNKALLYQEMGDTQNEISSLEMALLIATHNGEKYEIAVTHSNLANTYLGRLDYDKAREEALIAVSSFGKLKTEDEHLAAGLYVLGVTMGNDGEEYLNKALKIVEKHSGKSEFYYKIQDALKNFSKGEGYGLRLSKELYKKHLEPALLKELPEYTGKIAVGLLGRGSDCYGFDDELSRDHDWGPDLCIFVSKETYAQIGDKLEKIYLSLPTEINGEKRAKRVSSHKRHGVFIYEDFFKDLLGTYPLKGEDYENVPDYAFSFTQNGEIFTDPEGKLTEIRNEIKNNIPESFRLLKIAELSYMFSQAGQYNLIRVRERGDEITEKIMLGHALKYAMQLAHVLDKKFMPQDKWLHRSSQDLSFGKDFSLMLRDSVRTGSCENLAGFLLDIMKKQGIVDSSDTYLTNHRDDIIAKALRLKEQELGA